MSTVLFLSEDEVAVVEVFAHAALDRPLVPRRSVFESLARKIERARLADSAVASAVGAGSPTSINSSGPAVREHPGPGNEGEASMHHDRTGPTGPPADHRRTLRLVEVALGAGFLFGVIAGLAAAWAVIL